MTTNRRSLDASGRERLVLAALGLVTLLLLGRAAYLQLINSDELQSRGADRHMRVVEVSAHRGMIVDRNGEPLAVSTPVDSIAADPQILLAHRDWWPALAQVLGLSEADLTQRIEAYRERRYMSLQRRMVPDQARRVMALGVPGVYAQREYRRFYPSGEVASHVLGLTNHEDRGQDGLERMFDDWLAGTPGKKRVIRDGNMTVVADLELVQAPQPGHTLTLTLDSRIQYLAYRALKSAMMSNQAAGGSAVVVDVTNGEILALVNQPGGNPNDRGNLEIGKLRNRAVTDVFEPGSTLKPFTVIAALQSGVVGIHTPIDTTSGQFKVGRNLVRDVRDFGPLDVSRVITKSSNVGVAKIALAMPPERLWSLYRAVGFGQIPQLPVSGAVSGVLTDPKGWNDFEYATHSFGYGLSVSAVQLAQAYQVLAADGLLRPLALIRDGQPAAEATRVMDADAVRAVRLMMETVVGPEGTAGKAAVPGYRVAGKTGTVRKIVNGGYSTQHYQSLFAGIAPASNPRLAIVIIVDDAQGKAYYGGQVAAPVFSEVMTGALRVLNVPPDGQLAGDVTLAARVEGSQ